MDGENKFWLSFCILVAMVLTVVTITMWSSDRYAMDTLNDMVGKGVPPIAARCAIYGVSEASGRTAICVIAAQQESAK